MLRFDLHSHSTRSDGLLAPAALVARAAERGVRTLALTDHDELGGLPEARGAAIQHDIKFINGVEISVSWNGETLHVLGLRIDPAHPELETQLALLREGRRKRANLMAKKLEEIGIEGALEGATAHVSNPEFVGRNHFARFLARSGYAKNEGRAFDKYLARGKPGYVDHKWAPLWNAVQWITSSGGTAVLAHPGRYRLSESNVLRLLYEFKEVGGEAIEVVTSNHNVRERTFFAHVARRLDLLASCGSDFHDPNNRYRDFRQLPDLPVDLKPVWWNWN